MRRIALVLCIVAGWPALAQDNVIHQYSPNYMLNGSDTAPDPAFLTIDQQNGRVRIKAALPNEPFAFDATLLDGQTYVGPGPINAILADPNVGDFSITLVGSAGHEFGADDVGQISLIGTNTNGRIDQLKISGTLARNGSVAAALGLGVRGRRAVGGRVD